MGKTLIIIEGTKPARTSTATFPGELPPNGLYKVGAGIGGLLHHLQHVRYPGVAPGAATQRSRLEDVWRTTLGDSRGQLKYKQPHGGTDFPVEVGDLLVIPLAPVYALHDTWGVYICDGSESGPADVAKRITDALPSAAVTQKRNGDFTQSPDTLVNTYPDWSQRPLPASACFVFPVVPASATKSVVPGKGTTPATWTLDRDFFITKAYQAAFPAQGRAVRWVPADGFLANKANMVAVYNYYRDLLNYDPKLWWAGLGRMAGAAVYGGLLKSSIVEGIATPDTGLFRTTFVEIGKHIFLDMAWQHEAYRYCKDQKGGNFDDLFRLTRERDKSPTDPTPEPGREYEGMWRLVVNATASDNDPDLTKAAVTLARNEQKIIIQDHYKVLMADVNTSWVVDKLGLSTPNIHPYHRSFTNDMGTSANVADFSARWTWMTRPQGMLENWAACGNAERKRLANLPLEPNLVMGQWGTLGKPELAPPGAPGDDD